jgi:hypothetical protein
MTNGVTNLGVAVHCGSPIQNHKHGSLKVQSQLMPIRAVKYEVSKSNILDSIETVINGLSSLIPDANKTAQSTTATNDSSYIVNDETWDDFLISLIEQLLETLQDLVRDEREDATATSEVTNTLITNAPVISVNSEQMGVAISKKPQHSLELQLYSLIEFMQDVNDNLQEAGDDRVSELMGYLEQEYEEQRYQDRRNNIMRVLSQFLEE